VHDGAAAAASEGGREAVGVADVGLDQRRAVGHRRAVPRERSSYTVTAWPAASRRAAITLPM